MLTSHRMHTNTVFSNQCHWILVIYEWDNDTLSDQTGIHFVGWSLQASRTESVVPLLLSTSKHACWILSVAEARGPSGDVATTSGS